MTTGSAYAGDDPHQLLSGARELARRVREQQRATWFPLLVFAAATFAAIPVARYGGRAQTCRTVHLVGPVGPPGSVIPAGAVGRVCSVYIPALFVYWPIAAVLAYVAIAAFYLHRSRARGVGTRVRPYVITGIIIAALVTGASVWAAHNPPVGPPPGAYHLLGLTLTLRSAGLTPLRLFNAAGAIGLALLVLAWVERNRALLVFTIGYLVIVLVPVRFGWVIALPSPWYMLPRLVIDGTVLLLGGIGFALAQRRARVPAA